ncbi:17073_t:CDS:2, partial [Acaulospora colombiana]
MNVIWEEEVVPPIQNLFVRVVGILRAKGRVPDKTFKHDGTQRPPIALVAVPLHQKDFRGNIIRSSDRRLSAVGFPGCNLVLARDVEQALVIPRIMLLVEPSRQSKVGQFDVAFSVDQNVVGLDISVWERGKR